MISKKRQSKRNFLLWYGYGRTWRSRARMWRRSAGPGVLSCWFLDGLLDGRGPRLLLEVAGKWLRRRERRSNCKSCLSFSLRDDEGAGSVALLLV